MLFKIWSINELLRFSHLSGEEKNVRCFRKKYIFQKNNRRWMNWIAFFLEITLIFFIYLRFCAQTFLGTHVRTVCTGSYAPGFFGSHQKADTLDTPKRFKRNTVEPLGTDTSLIRTPLYHGQFSMSRQNFHIFSLKKNLCNTDSR